MTQHSDETSIADLIGEGAAAIRDLAENPAGRARSLISSVTGISLDALLAKPEALVGMEDAERCRKAMRRHASGEPVSRIIGEREFWGLTFHLSEETLDPRPDTETLVEAVLQLLPDRDATLSFLDLGTGTGAVGTAILSEYRNATCLGVDRAEGAVRMSRRNAHRNGVGERYHVFTGSWIDSVCGQFDVIVSNPPYIRCDELDGLEIGVRDHDPMLALDGGEDGLDAYRSILNDAARCLKPGGYLLLEIGLQMGEQVRQLASDPLDARPELSSCDLSARERVVGFQKKHLE